MYEHVKQNKRRSNNSDFFKCCIGTFEIWNQICMMTLPVRLMGYQAGSLSRRNRLDGSILGAR